MSINCFVMDRLSFYGSLVCFSLFGPFICISLYFFWFCFAFGMTDRLKFEPKGKGCELSTGREFAHSVHVQDSSKASELNS